MYGVIRRKLFCRFYRVRCGKTVKVFISLGYSLFGIWELTVLQHFCPLNVAEYRH